MDMLRRVATAGILDLLVWKKLYFLLILILQLGVKGETTLANCSSLGPFK